MTATVSVAQTASGSFCYSDELHAATLAANPELRQRLEAMEESIRESLAVEPAGRRPAATSTSSTYVIPVVVYVVHNGGVENITDAQVMSQLAALNAAFAGHGIRFCLATAMNGAPLPGLTPGIIRVQSTFTNHHTATEESALKTLAPLLPGDRYLRIWVVKDIDNHSGIVGYARFPGSVPTALEGIVMRYDVFGDAATCPGCPLLANYNQGKVLAHEVGHVLNLFHTFQGGCSGLFASDCATSGDHVCDTPQIAAASSGCPALGSVQSCDGSPALIKNHMDYTNDVCRMTFTAGQEARMLATLATLRQLLVAPQNLVFTGVQCLSGIDASFAAGSYNPCAGQAVAFQAVNNAGATYAWSFGDGGVSALQSPTHAYASAGTYAVTLTVTSGGNSVTSTQTVFVSNCAPIVSSQGNWFFKVHGELHFASGVPIAGNAALTHNTMTFGDEAAVTQSDAAGNLLFYSDGKSVWDSQHNQAPVMLTGYETSTQALSVPDPADPNPSDPHSFYLIAMTAYGAGLGTVGSFTSTKVSVSGSSLSFSAVNTPIPPPAGADNRITEQITAIPGCGGMVWIIVHGSFLDSNPSFRYSLFVYPLTASGFGTPTAYSIVGPSRFGQLKASPDGTKVVYGGGDGSSTGSSVEYAYVVDFDRNTGALGNARIIHRYAYGVSFSPNSKVLYLTSVSAVGQQLFQYDLSASDLDAAERLVATTANPFSSLQLGPDNKLYMALHGATHIAVVTNPDVLTTASAPNACGFVFNGPELNVPSSATGSGSGYGLPNMIDARPLAQNPASFGWAVSDCSTVAFQAPSCAASYAWSFGDGATSTAQNPTHVYADGTYTVTLTLNGSASATRTLTVGLPPGSTSVFGPRTICLAAGNPPFYNYSANAQSGLTYEWSAAGGVISGVSTNDNADVVWSALPGTLTLTVTNPLTGCTAASSITVTENCSANQCLPRPPGLTAWWPFDEVLGTIAHDIAGVTDNAGTYVNGPQPVAGLVGPALEFDGVGSYVVVNDDPDLNFYYGCILDFAEPTTIDVWVHVNIPPGTSSSSGVMTILDKRVVGTSTAALGYSLFLFNGRLGFQMNGTNFVAPASGPDFIDVADNQWHFVAVSLPTCRGHDDGFLYVDGRKVLSLPRSFGFVNGAKLYIGRRDPAFGPNFFHGSLDELEIFKNVLSEDDLRLIFEARGHGKCKASCAQKSIAIAPAALPILGRGLSYVPVVDLSASGGTAPYTFAVTSGSLPQGLSLSSAGSLAGTPAVAGVYTFTVTVADADGCRSTRTYQLTVLGGRRRASVP
ncbi:MAG TPA: PKD domain-containing protein [Thermoanaerobaculia bacterium]|nr:PKD domain-containing protein [Thermoanaerobaculia bacterium]